MICALGWHYYLNILAVLPSLNRNALYDDWAYSIATLYYLQILVPYTFHVDYGPLSFDVQRDLPFLAVEIYVIQKQNQA